MLILGRVSLKTIIVDIIPNNRRVDDAHRGRIAAESEGSQNGRISKSDSPLTIFPPIDYAMEVISNASTAVDDCRIANCL